KKHFITRLKSAEWVSVGTHYLHRYESESTYSSNRMLSSDFQDKIPENLDNVKIKTFVLVHGEGFGAWCWYKTIAYLEEVGLVPVALDLTGSGIDTTDSNCIMTLADYSKPLISYLEQLPDDEKVILVGHSTGGASVSYALELFPEKISKAIFVCATMLGSAELFMKESQFLIHGNGKNNPPTGFMFEKQLMKSLYFNQSPTKDVALAMVSMRPAPICPTMEKLSLTAEKYGTSRRFFVQTLEDRALSADVQEKLVRENPPEGVYNIKGSDHCPFFSKPQSLHKILVEIAQIE
ncbi:Putative methylesterase 14, chloroplastic, partial [Linum perenne]